MCILPIANTSRLCYNIFRVKEEHNEREVVDMRTYEITVWGENLCVVYIVKATDSLEAFGKAQEAFYADGYTDYNEMVAEKRG